MGKSRRKSSNPHHEPQNPEIKHSNPIHKTVEQVQSSISSLPTELVLDILSRLSINTVGNCMCVCKSWYRAIHTPIFSTMQFNRAPKIKTLIVQDHTRCSNLRLVDLEHDYQGNSENSNEKLLIGLNTPFFRLSTRLKFLGSCNGLLCLCMVKERFIGADINECIFVCNPLIGEYMAIPPPSLSPKIHIGSGFGFDSAANEYKIIRMALGWVDFEDKKKPSFELVAEVYTIGSGMWRNIGNVPYPINSQPSSAFVNGALHWMSDNTGLIVSFDVAGEEFRVVPHPPSFCHVRPKNCLLHLGVLGGRLCLFDKEFTNEYINIWVMKEYGVEKSWTQQYVIRPYLRCLEPLSFVMNENILFLCNGKQLICYDLLKKKFSIPRIIGLPSNFSAIVHEGSLISLGNFGEMMRVISSFQRKVW